MEGYSYSGANKKAGVTWNDENIMKWLENPKKVHQGKQNGLCRPQETPGSHGHCRLPEEDLRGVTSTTHEIQHCLLLIYDRSTSISI